MQNSNYIINIIREKMNRIEQYHVTKLALFGSFVRGEQNENSDVDILVEFEKEFETFDNYMDLKFYMEELFGRKVDLVIFDSIKPALRTNILRSAEYAKGA